MASQWSSQSTHNTLFDNLCGCGLQRSQITPTLETLSLKYCKYSQHLTKMCLCIHISMHVCGHTCLCMCAVQMLIHTCLRVGGHACAFVEPQGGSGCFITDHPYCFRWSPTAFGAHPFQSLRSQRAPLLYLSFWPKCQGYRYEPPLLAFMWVLGIQIQVLMIVQQIPH